MRDWSKRLVAGADKKLHPKKVSPSPPASPLAPHPHQPDSSSLFPSLRCRYALFPPRAALCIPLSPPPAASLNSSTARQASQTSGIHYSCRPTPLDGGTLKIVRKQIRPAPTPPLALHLIPPPTGVSTRRRASYAIARNDARLIGTTRDIFFFFSLPPSSFLLSPLLLSLLHHRSYVS